MSVLAEISKRARDLHANGALAIACLGDSVTHGCFETFVRADGSWECQYDPVQVYHARLRQKLAAWFPSVPVNVLNAGVSGGSAPGGLSRLERDVLRYQPSLATVCFGLNDVMGGPEGLSQYESALSGILKALREREIPTVFITPNMMATEVDPALTDPGLRGAAARSAELQLDGTMDSFMDAARRLCGSFGIPVCDYYALWKKLSASGADTTRLLSNRINHPNREMHGCLAELLTEMIREERV